MSVGFIRGRPFYPIAMADNNGFDMDQYETELDQIIAPIMPDDHPVQDRV